MRRLRRTIMTAAALGVGLTLAGCGSFDPSDWFDFERKKPIPGERKLVFPEGVPGVPQGVPQELVRGNQQAVDPAMITAVDESKPAEGTTTAAAGPAPAAAKTAAKPKPKPKVASRPKAKPRPKQAATPKQPSQPSSTAQPASQASARPASQQSDSAIWGPPPGQAQNQGAATPWPAPTPQRAPTAPWPDPPSPNTFSR